MKDPIPAIIAAVTGEGATQFMVTLTCGHSWREHRPAKLPAPVQGELRACGSFEHYPNQYPATYVAVPGDGDA